MLFKVDVVKVTGAPPEIPEFSSSTWTLADAAPSEGLMLLRACDVTIRLPASSLAERETLVSLSFSAVPNASPMIESRVSVLGRVSVLLISWSTVKPEGKPAVSASPKSITVDGGTSARLMAELCEMEPMDCSGGRARASGSLLL